MILRFQQGDLVVWQGQPGRIISVSPKGVHCVELHETGDQIATVAQYLTRFPADGRPRTTNAQRHTNERGGQQ